MQTVEFEVLSLGRQGVRLGVCYRSLEKESWSSSFSVGIWNNRKEGRGRKLKPVNTCLVLFFTPTNATHIKSSPPPSALSLNGLSHIQTLAHLKYPWHWCSNITFHKRTATNHVFQSFFPVKLMARASLGKINTTCVLTFRDCGIE